MLAIGFGTSLSPQARRFIPERFKVLIHEEENVSIGFKPKESICKAADNAVYIDCLVCPKNSLQQKQLIENLSVNISVDSVIT